MKAKRPLIPVISFAALLVVLFVLLGLFIRGGTNEYTVLTDTLPESTVVFAAVSELELLLEVSDPSSPLSFFNAGFFLDEAFGGQRSPDWWIERGVALDEPVGFALLSLSPIVVVSSCGFNGEFDDLVELSGEFNILDDQSFSNDEIGGVSALVRDNLVIAANNGRLWSIVAFNLLSDVPAGAELGDVALQVLTGGFERTLSENDNYRALTDFEYSTRGLVYIDTAPILRLFIDEDDPLLSLLGVSTGMTLDDERMVWLSRARFDTATLDPTQYVGLGRHLEPLQRVPGPIWIGIHGSTDPRFLSEGLDLLSSYSRRLGRHVSHTREFLDEVVGIDLEDDILTHLTGELGLFVGPSQSGGEIDRLAVFAGVSSESELTEALEEVGIRLMGGRGYPPTLTDLPLDELGGVSVVRITLDSGTPGALFIDSGYLWMTVGESMAEHILEGGEPSFLTQSDAIEEHFASDSPAVAYVALPDVVRAGLVQDVDGFFLPGAGSFGDVFLSADVQSDLVLSETRTQLSSQTEATSGAQPMSPLRPGLSRANPTPLGTAVQLNGWQVEVLRE